MVINECNSDTVAKELLLLLRLGKQTRGWMFHEQMLRGIMLGEGRGESQHNQRSVARLATMAQLFEYAFKPVNIGKVVFANQSSNYIVAVSAEACWSYLPILSLHGAKARVRDQRSLSGGWDPIYLIPTVELAS
jgi:hypothetical protein